MPIGPWIGLDVSIFNKWPVPSAFGQRRDGLPPLGMLFPGLLFQGLDFHPVESPGINASGNGRGPLLPQLCPPAGFANDLGAPGAKFRVALWRHLHRTWLLTYGTGDMEKWSAKATGKLGEPSAFCTYLANCGTAEFHQVMPLRVVPGIAIDQKATLSWIFDKGETKLVQALAGLQNALAILLHVGSFPSTKFGMLPSSIPCCFTFHMICNAFATVTTCPHSESKRDICDFNVCISQITELVSWHVGMRSGYVVSTVVTKLFAAVSSYHNTASLTLPLKLWFICFVWFGFKNAALHWFAFGGCKVWEPQGSGWLGRKFWQADAGRLFCFGSGTACRNFRIGRPKVGKTKAFWAGLASAPASGCSGTFGPGMLYWPMPEFSFDRAIQKFIMADMLLVE